jgi:hypothetical protein
VNTDPQCPTYKAPLKKVAVAVHDEGAANRDVIGPRLYPLIVAALVMITGAADDIALMVAVWEESGLRGVVAKSRKQDAGTTGKRTLKSGTGSHMSLQKADLETCC